MLKLGSHGDDQSLDQQTGILVFKEKRYAVGLTWLTSENETSASLVKDRAKRLKADFYCVRATIVNQQGFGYLALGHRIAMPSAASIAAEMMVGEWHGIFAADNGWWYLAVHSDAIAPDGDRLFFSEEEAYNFFVQRAEEYKWPRSYAPAAWNLPDTNGDVPIDRLLEDPSMGSVLKPTNLDAAFGGPANKRMAVLGGLALLGLVMLMALLPTLFSGLMNQQNQVVATLSLNVADVIKPPPPEPAEEEAPKITFSAVMLPVPSALLARCAGLFDGIITPVPGWQLETASCDTAAATANWRRKSGRLEDLQQVAARFPAQAQRSFSGDNGFVVIVPMGSLRDIEKPARVLEKDDVILALSSRFQPIGELQVKYVVPPPPPPPSGPPGVRNLEQPKPNPPFLQLNLTTEMPPSVIATYFDVPGLSLQTVSWNIGSRSWTYVAQILVDSEQLRALQESPG